MAQGVSCMRACLLCVVCAAAHYITNKKLHMCVCVCRMPVGGPGSVLHACVWPRGCLACVCVACFVCIAAHHKQENTCV